MGALSPGLDFLGRAMKILGRPPIRPHERLKQIFLTHLTFDPDLGLQQKEQALQKLIDSSYRKAIREGIHLVSWIEPRSHSFKRKVQPRIIFDVPAQLYEVVADGEVIQTESLRSAPVYFEGAVL